MDGDIEQDQMLPQEPPQDVPEETMEQAQAEEPMLVETLDVPEPEQVLVSASPALLDGATPEAVKMEDTKPSTPNDMTPPVSDGTPNYRTKYIMSGHARSIAAIKFSPDGTMLASCGEYY